MSLFDGAFSQSGAGGGILPPWLADTLAALQQQGGAQMPPGDAQPPSGFADLQMPSAIDGLLPASALPAFSPLPGFLFAPASLDNKTGVNALMETTGANAAGSSPSAGPSAGSWPALPPSPQYLESARYWGAQPGPSDARDQPSAQGSYLAPVPRAISAFTRDGWESVPTNPADNPAQIFQQPPSPTSWGERMLGANAAGDPPPDHWQPGVRLAGDLFPRSLTPWESGQAGIGYGGGSGGRGSFIGGGTAGRSGFGGSTSGGRSPFGFAAPAARSPADVSEQPIAAPSAARPKRKKIDEAECDAQYDSDLFQCNMVGLPECYAQAMERYSACLAGRPIPPFNY